MEQNRLKSLRVLVIVVLVLLALQFEFGMAVNIANPPSIDPFSFSLARVSDALHGVGAVALVHAGLGGFLALLSVLGLILSLGSGIRGAQVFGGLAFLAVLLAATSGLLFVLSGFQNDGYSHGMATNFIFAFSFYFLELYALKPAPSPR